MGPSGGPRSCVGDGADPTVILDRTNPNRAAADRYARKILSIDLPSWPYEVGAAGGNGHAASPGADTISR